MKKLFLKTFWDPFERYCTNAPLIPLKLETVQINEYVTQIKINNVVTKAIARFGGGYEYSTLYLINNKILVDTGFSWAKRNLKKYIIEQALGETLVITFNTHAHEDHVGNNDIIESLTNSKIYAHPNAVASIKYPPQLPWYRSFMFGRNVPSNAVETPSSVTCDDLEFNIIETPGHSDDHICLYEKNKGWLFSGDLYVAPDLDSQLHDVNGPKWIQSLQKIVKLAPTALFDGHGIIVEGEQEVLKVLEEKLHFLENLEKRILQELDSPKPLEEVIKNVFNDKNIVNLISVNEGWLSILTDSDFSRSNLVSSFIKNHYPNHLKSNESNELDSE